MVTTIDQNIAKFFNDNFGLGGDWSWGNAILIAIALILCSVLCGLIGIERERRGRSAGLRTHLLVGLGSCIIMIISIYGFPTAERDVARLAAQVVAGVGFLGAGTIIHYNGGIKGLTTASTIWLVMAIGLACGSFNFILALATTILVMIFLIVFRNIEKKIVKSNPLVGVLVDAKAPIATILLTTAKCFGYELHDVKSQFLQDGDAACIEVIFRIGTTNGGDVDVTAFVEAIKKEVTLRNFQVYNQH